MSDETTVASPRRPPLRELDAGFRIGPYTLTGRVIGSGGFAHVYEATHPTLGLRVAIKVQDARGDATDRARSLREALVLARIQHRNVVQIFDAGDLEDGRQYLAMELLAGETLRDLSASTALSVPQKLAFLRGIANALDAVHARGLVHRDLKPSNILVCRDDDGETYSKLIDFGIAKDLALAGDRELTTSGSFIGTPAYMSPEQCLGKRTIDARSDIYALGVVAYELLAGHPPFEGAMIEVAHAHAHSPVPSIRVEHPDLPVELDAVLAQILAKDPDKRPSTARDAIELLEGALIAGGPLATSTPRSTSSRSARRFAVLGAIGGVALIAAGLGAWSAHHDSGSAHLVPAGQPARFDAGNAHDVGTTPRDVEPAPTITTPQLDAGIRTVPDAAVRPRPHHRRQPAKRNIDDVESLPPP